MQLTKELKNSETGLLNIQNYNDEKHFMLSVLTTFHPTSAHSARAAKYASHEGKLNMSGISYHAHL